MSSDGLIAIPLEQLIFDFAADAFPTGGFYIEAGAHDGVSFSNTVRLDKKLWTGILVEPSKVAFKTLVVNRPDAILENYALVGDESVEFLKGSFEDGSLMGSAHPVLMKRDSARPKNHVQASLSGLRSRLGLPPRVRMSTVEAITLDKIIEKNGVETIDLLILDVEGLELEILKTFSFSPKPRVIVVETRSNDAQEIADIILRAGYVLAANFSNFSKERNPHFSGDHQDYVWVSKADRDLIDAVSHTHVFN